MAFTRECAITVNDAVLCAISFTFCHFGFVLVFDTALTDELRLMDGGNCTVKWKDAP